MFKLLGSNGGLVRSLGFGKTAANVPSEAIHSFYSRLPLTKIETFL